MSEREPRYRCQMLSAGWKARFAASGRIHVTGPASPDRPIQPILIVTYKYPVVTSCTSTGAIVLLQKILTDNQYVALTL